MLVYHYTSAATLALILGTKNEWNINLPTFRMSHFRFMNDTSEFAKVADIIAFARAQEQRYENGSPYLIQTLEEITTLVPPYVASFSEAVDSLSQWRGYARGPEGVAIGVDVSRVDFERRPEIVEYAPKDIAWEFEVSRCLDRLEIDHVKPTGQALAMVRQLVKKAIRTKSNAFSEEREFRSVAFQLSPSGHYPGPFGMTPYFALDLDKAAIREVWLAPGAAASAKEGMESYLRGNGYEHVAVHRSGSSFRHGMIGS